MRERQILLIDMDAFFASCEQAADPRLRGKPIIVCGNPETRSVVAACSYEAKVFGITNGMSVRQARALCPEVIPVPGQPDLYIHIAESIFGGLSRYTPLAEVVSIDEAFLDVTDTWKRFGTPEAIARRIQKEVEGDFKLTCTVGIGPNKLLAKLATEQAKPRGLKRISPTQLPQCLEHLPVNALCGIGPRITEHLAQIKIQTLGELAAAPVRRLKACFGVYGETLHQMALGIDETPVLAEDHPDLIKSMGHMYTLQRDTRDPKIVQGTLLKLSEKVGRRLRAERLAARTVCVTVRFHDFTGFSRQHTGIEVLNDGLSIYRAALRLLPAAGGAKPVRLVGVSASGLVVQEPLLDLWEDRRRKRRLVESLDQINDLYGEATIQPAGAMVPFVRKTKGYFGPRWS